MEEKKRKTADKEELANIMVLEQNRLQNERAKEQEKYGKVNEIFHHIVWSVLLTRLYV